MLSIWLLLKKNILNKFIIQLSWIWIYDSIINVINTINNTHLFKEIVVLEHYCILEAVIN